MVRKYEKQLNEFFEHALSPAEEQNFLISVAASDELRIAFRSQLELMKAVRSDKDSLRIGASGPVAQVRNRTLAALGLSATAATPFIEQELLRSGRSEQSIAATETASLAGPGMRWVGHLLHTPVAAIATGLVLGILSTTAVEHFTASNATHVSSAIPARVVSAAIPKTRTIPLRPRTIETIPAKNGLHNIDARATRVGNPVKPVQSRMIGHAQRIAREPSATMIGAASSKVAASKIAASKAAARMIDHPAKIPEVTRNNPGVMQVRKAAIIQTNDSAKAKK